MSVRQAYETQLAVLEAEFERQLSQAGGQESRSSVLLRRARVQLDEAAAELTAGELSQFVVRSRLARAMCNAMVVLDSVAHPDTAPEVGWARSDEGRSGRMVDTQLMRLFFDIQRGGELTAFWYKPRKINFCNAAASGELLPCLKNSLVFGLGSGSEQSTAFCGAAAIKTTASTPDVLTLRSTVSAEGAALATTLDFHAGFGAHLKEATTGLALEFELEGQNLEQAVFCSEWNFAMQSGEIEGLSAYALKAVGGVEDGLHYLNVPRELTAADARGGLYGVRLIDGVGSLVVDFRTARPLEKLCIDPLSDAGGFQGSRLRFFYPAADLIDPRRRATLFISIV